MGKLGGLTAARATWAARASWAAWATISVLAIGLLAQPVSVGAQLALGLACIAGMSAAWALGRGRFGRQLFLAFGSFVVIRYVYWRVSGTLPPAEDAVGFGFGVLLLLAEVYCVLILTISLLINADPLERAALPRGNDADQPTVDVFIPTYNEDEYILATTVAAAKSMDYPADKLTVWLLDDGGTDQKCNDKDPVKAAAAQLRRASLQKLCAELGAIYSTRAKNQHAKAGNMNAALEKATGEIVVVFDADHAPFRAFLRETVGLFARDPKLFLVQTPHVFINPDPIEKNLRTFARMPSENEMFYSITQRGLDKWNGSFFCGSAALLRRAALQTTGGFSGVTITEDCETAFELHAKGWTSAFVDKPLIAGLQPETFGSFIGQRSRWCQGMFQIMMLKNPALKGGLHFIQRIAYLSSMTFWFFPLPRLVFMFTPLLHIFLDVKLFVSNIDEAIAYTSVYIVVNMMMQNRLYGRMRWPFVSELYEYVQGVYLAKAIGSVVVSPRKPTFNVTAKGLTLDNDHLSELALPYFVIYALLLAGGLTAAYRYLFEPGVTDLMLVVGLWNTFNMIIAGAGLGAVAERAEPRQRPRLTTDRRAVLVTEAGARVPVAVLDVSTGGVAARPLEEGAVLPEGLRGRLIVEPVAGEPPRGPRAARASLPVRVVRASGALMGRRIVSGGVLAPPEAAGLKFEALGPEDYYALADVMYGDSAALPRFLDSRRAHRNLVLGTLEFVWWGLREPFRAARYAAIPRAKAAPEPAPLPAAAAVPQASTEGLRRLLEQAHGAGSLAAPLAAPAKVA